MRVYASSCCGPRCIRISSWAPCQATKCTKHIWAFKCGENGILNDLMVIAQPTSTSRIHSVHSVQKRSKGLGSPSRLPLPLVLSSTSSQTTTPTSSAELHTSRPFMCGSELLLPYFLMPSLRMHKPCTTYKSIGGTSKAFLLLPL